MVDDFSSAALLLVTGLDDIFYANSGFRDLRFVSCPFSVVVHVLPFIYEFSWFEGCGIDLCIQ